MKIKLAGMLCALMLLCSCSSAGIETESLLHSPALNRQQEEVYAAMEDVLNLSEIRYKYPQRGDYRAPFAFYDMDRDGQLEAIVFYAHEDDLSTTCVKILRQDANGKWINFHDFSMESDQVDFVQFGHLLSTDTFCMIIGWQSTSSQSGQVTESILGVYSLRGDQFTAEIVDQSYLDYTVYDFNGDGLDEIATIERDEQNGGLSLSLLCSVELRLDVVGTLALSGEAVQPLRLTPGTLWDGSTALFIDESCSEESWATEIVRVSENRLQMLVGGENEKDYALTRRESGLYTDDYDGNGSMDIPGAQIGGNTGEEEETERPGMTPFMQMTANGLGTTRRAVVNHEEGYLVFFPDKWLDWVSVIPVDETGQWRFFLADPETGDPVIELLRIQSYTEPKNSLTAENGWIALGSRGATQFAGYIPLTAEDIPKITEQELKAMFRVLP